MGIKILSFFSLALLGASVSCYIFSLIVPAFGCHYFGADSFQFTIEPGYMILLMGWLGVSVLNFAWIANLTYVITLILVMTNHLKWAYYFSVATLLIGLSGLLIYFDKANLQVGLYLGFYLWIGSFVLLVICAALNKIFWESLN